MNPTSIAVESGAGKLAFPGIASGASWTLAASVSAALSQWLLLMFTAKLGSPEMVGHLALSFAVVAPIQILTDLALRTALATDAGREFPFKDYLRLRVMMTAVCLTTVLVAAALRGGPAAPIMIVIGLQKAAESASDLFYGLFQRDEKLNWMGQSVLLRSTLASIAFAVVMLTNGSLLMACLAGLVVRIGILCLHDAPRGSGLASLHESGKSRVGDLFKASLPLATGLFLMSFAVNIPRYFVEKRMGAAALGVFAALIYVFQAGAMLIDAVSQASCARLARYHLLADAEAFRALVLKLSGLALLASGVGVVVAVAGGSAVLRLVYSAAFSAQAKPFVWLSVCTAPWYCSSVFGYAIVARRQMRSLFYCQGVSLGATVAGSYWLIGESGLGGACRVVFLTYCVLAALYAVVLWQDPREGERLT